MRKAMMVMILPLAVLAACEMKVGKDDGAGNKATLKVGEDGNVAIAATEGADGVSVSLPGFDAKMNIPGIELGGGNMDVDGMKLYPGSAVKGINVTDQKGEGNSRVEMRFTSPASPDKVAAYYADAARDEDFANINVSNSGGKAILTAKKADGDDLTIMMEPAAGGTTTGQILIKGQK